jgi:glutathione S-transferase
MIAPQLDFIASLPEWETLSGPHGNLQDWMRRMNQRPSMQATTWERVAAMARAA